MEGSGRRGWKGRGDRAGEKVWVSVGGEGGLLQGGGLGGGFF